MRARLLAALLICVPAWLMTPLVNQAHQERRQLQFGGATVTRELRDQIGQNLTIALLAGFRGLAADLIWIRGHAHWEKQEWFKQSECIENAVQLQPQSTLFWDVGAWHMAWNIAYAERIATNNATVAQGIVRERHWHNRGRALLERGIANVPNRYDLYFKLGWLYDQKLVRHCDGNADCEREQHARAAEYFRQAAAFPNAPAYMARTAARAIEKSGDRRGAYEYWLELYSRENLRTDAFSRAITEREIQRLQDELDNPPPSRLSPQPSVQ